MSSRTTLLSVAAGLVVLGGVTAAVLAYRGATREAVLGAGLGVLLGVGGTATEVLLVGRALHLPRGGALGIVLGGFALRLLVLVGVTLALSGLRFADAAAFAICFAGAFLAALPVLAAVTAGRGAPGGGGAGG